MIKTDLKAGQCPSNNYHEISWKYPYNMRAAKCNASKSKESSQFEPWEHDGVVVDARA